MTTTHLLADLADLLADLADQLMCYYSVGRKSMKSWLRVLWRMIDHCITNAYVIMANNASSVSQNMTRLQFRLSLVEQLTAPILASKQGPGRNPCQFLSRLVGKHFIY